MMRYLFNFAVLSCLVLSCFGCHCFVLSVSFPGPALPSSFRRSARTRFFLLLLSFLSKYLYPGHIHTLDAVHMDLFRVLE